MRKLLSLIVLSSCLLFLFFPMREIAVKVESYDGLRVHNLTSGRDFTAIQEAIDDPSTLNGHVVRVDSGTYFEHVTVSKSLSFVGEDRDLTIVDGNGTGTTWEIAAVGVNLINMTVRNAGRDWGIPPGQGYPDSCIRGIGFLNVNIENTTLESAAVCLMLDFCYFFSISDCTVHDATYIGMVGYASQNITFSRNLVYDYGSDGIHLDGGSTFCRIINNTVENGFVGISLEESLTSQNLLDGNHLVNNNVSVGFYSSGHNILRRNDMTGAQYDLLIWGTSFETFNQDIDASNVADDLTVYYLTNMNNVTIDPVGYPSVGYLALVNCTNVTIKDLSINHNGDGLILACTTNCTVSNITLEGNIGPLMYGGLMLFSSSNNHIVGNLIVNHSYAVCLDHSDGNIFCQNSFVNNSRQTVANYTSPFNNRLSDYTSTSTWDDGFEGNYWSDYNGSDDNRDGIGDLPYMVVSQTQQQLDRYPLMGRFHRYCIAAATAEDCITVISNSTILAANIVHEPINLHGGTKIILEVEGEASIGFCRICISYSTLSPPYSIYVDGRLTPVLYVNDMVFENGTHRWIYFTYPHTRHQLMIVPEHTLLSSFLASLTASSAFATILKRKIRTKKPRSSVGT